MHDKHILSGSLSLKLARVISMRIVRAHHARDTRAVADPCLTYLHTRPSWCAYNVFIRFALCTVSDLMSHVVVVVSVSSLKCAPDTQTCHKWEPISVQLGV